VVSAKLIGVLKLLDKGEQDDKLIAVQFNSPLKKSDSIEELDEKFPGITQILELWFTNYKGTGKMKSNGFGDLEEAERILNAAAEQFEKAASQK
jgi:inorganic pyrophosphatase